MPEYVIVTWTGPTERDVEINGSQLGKTGLKLTCSEGEKVFTLAGDPPTSPPEHDVTVEDTSEEFPMELLFEPVP